MSTPLRVKLDKVFSLYIRHKYSRDGMCECYTCGDVKPIKEIHCGHFISRAYYSLRWDENNTRPQCQKCNIFKAGEQYAFGKRLEAELGEDVVADMRIKKNTPARLKKADYQDMIDHFTNELKRLKDEA